LFAEPAQYAELAALPVVELESHPFAVLLAAHHEVGSSGLLVAHRGRIEKKVLLESGVPVDCRSNLVHETLSRFLTHAGKLSAEEANAALSRAVAEGRLVGELLIEEQRIAPDELQRALQQNLARKLFDLFTWKSGEVRLEPGQHHSETGQKLKVPRLIATGVRRFMPQEGVDRLVAPIAGNLLSLHPEWQARASDVRPDAFEKQLIDALATPRRLDELIGLLDRPADELARTVLALALVGLLVSADAVRRSRPAPAMAHAESAPTQSPAAAPPPPTPPPPAPPKPDPAIVASRIAKVEQARARLDGQDAFDILSLGDEAAEREIRERFESFAREHAPWQFDAPELAPARKAARELFLAGALAFARLSDPAQREALRISRRARREESARESRASYFKIETDLLDADAQYRRGLALRDEGKLELAQQQFEFAADCDPQNGIYAAEAALCRFRLAPSVHARQALEDLKEAHRVDPQAAEPLLYTGEICSELSRYAEAEVNYRKAAKLLGPEDRRALDALHELGRRKRRKK